MEPPWILMDFPRAFLEWINSWNMLLFLKKGENSYDAAV